MAEDEKNSSSADVSGGGEKVHIDDDDILAELGLAEDNKAELDSEGILEKEDTKEKALLDKDGIFSEDEAISVESEQPEAEEASAAEQPAATADDTPKEPFFKKYQELPVRLTAFFRRFPLKKTAFICCGTLILVLGGWMLASSIFFSPSNDHDLLQPVVPQHRSERGIRGDISQIALEPFLVPLVTGADNSVHFLRVSVIIGLGYDAPSNMQPLLKKMRLTIYGFLAEKTPENFSDDTQKRQIKRSLVHLLNKVLQKDIIRNVDFQSVSLV